MEIIGCLKLNKSSNEDGIKNNLHSQISIFDHQNIDPVLNWTGTVTLMMNMKVTAWFI